MNGGALTDSLRPTNKACVSTTEEYENHEANQPGNNGLVPSMNHDSHVFEYI
jgi:hypothetical protein